MESFARFWYAEVVEKVNKNPRNVKRYIDKDIVPSLGTKQLADVTTTDILELCDRIKKRGADQCALAVRNVLKRMYAYAIARERVSFNPAAAIQAQYIARAKSRDRALTKEEVGKLLRAVYASGMRRSHKLAIHLLLLTMVRKGELIGAKWEHLDVKGREWHAEVTFPVKRPVLSAGDTFTFQKKDLTNDSVLGNQIVTITGRSESGYSLTVDKNLDFNTTPMEELSPDLGWRGKIDGKPSDAKWLDFPLVQGKTWKSHALWKNPIGAIGDEDIDYTVAGVETITVPAGTFEAVKVHGTGWWQMTGMSVQGGVGRPSAKGQTQMMDVWYSPQAKAIIKIEYSKTVPSGVRHEAYELTASKLNKEASAAPK